MLKDNFNLKRFGMLLRNQAVSNYKSWSIFLITILGFYILISMIMGLLNKYLGITYSSDGLNRTYVGFLFIGGYINSSLAFADTNNKLKSSIWLSIPGSTLEKYLVGLLLSSVGYTLFLTLGFVISSILSMALFETIFSIEHKVFNAFNIDLGIGLIDISVFQLSIIYILTQSIFLAGSIKFRSAPFIKTILTLAALNFFYTITFAIVLNLTTKSGLLDNTDIRIFTNLFINDSSGLAIKDIFIIIATGLTIFFNILGFQLLKEKEVKGGV